MRACKAALLGLTKTLAREHARDGITLNVVCPGPTDTNLFEEFRKGASNPEKLMGLSGAPFLWDALASPMICRAPSASSPATTPPMSRDRSCPCPVACRWLVNTQPENGGQEMSAEPATYTDILYTERPDGVAFITINRPDRYNAFRGRTVEELIDAFQRAGWNRDIGVIVLSGAGDKAFCTGGDQGAHDGQYDGPRYDRFADRGAPDVDPRCAETRDRAGSRFRHRRRQCPSPLCATSQSHRSAPQFGQVGPKVGSVDRASAPPIWRASWVRRRPARSGTCAAAKRPSRRAHGPRQLRCAP